MSRSLIKMFAVAVLFVALAAPQAHAALGDSLIASGGHIIARFEGQSAGFDSLLSLNGGPEFFPNHATPVGATLDLGDFAAGTPLDFVLHVLNTGDFFHTGPGAGNPDGVAHANVVYNFGEPGRTYIGFEDLFGGGDRDYNDNEFSFTNISNSVPEPSTYSLIVAGLGLLGFAGRRRSRRQD